jgi:hypothetical protein
MSVHPRIGPYITMAGKMVLAMSYIIALLMVTLMAFGVGMFCYFSINNQVVLVRSFHCGLFGTDACVPKVKII